MQDVAPHLFQLAFLPAASALGVVGAPKLVDGHALDRGEHVQNQVARFAFSILRRLSRNGADNMCRFDGAVWLTITGTGAGAITGVDTATLAYVWGHRNHVFFYSERQHVGLVSGDECRGRGCDRAADGGGVPQRWLAADGRHMVQR